MSLESNNNFEIPKAPPVAPQQFNAGEAHYYAMSNPNPGKNLGIAGLVLTFLVAPIGLILSIMALVKSKRAGFKNGLAVAGIVLSAIFTIISVVILIVVVPLAADLFNQCRDLGPGNHLLDNGITLTCNMPDSFFNN